MAVLREDEVTIRTLSSPEDFRPVPAELRSLYRKVAAANGISVIYVGYKRETDRWTLDIPGILETFEMLGSTWFSLEKVVDEYIVNEISRWIRERLHLQDPGVENRAPLTIGEATRRITDHMERCLTCSVYASCDERQRLETEADQIEALQEAAEVANALRSEAGERSNL